MVENTSVENAGIVKGFDSKPAKFDENDSPSEHSQRKSLLNGDADVSDGGKISFNRR